ncbi:MAG: tRNA (adenosine(37)-N6)-dimethylallyltransferase MiaA [Patescibacteria group bacterium]
MKKLLVILGPTASGKSALAVELARKFDGEVVSADSRQVYKDLNLASGKITPEETKGVPHHLIDVTAITRVFSVEEFRKLAIKKIDEIWKQGKLPILCGGSGFYIQAIVDNPDIPKVLPNQKLRETLSKKSLEELGALLASMDMKRFQSIDQKNPRRLVRAIEIATALGKVPRLKKKGIEAELLQIGIKTDNEILKKNIGKRLIDRFEKGMIEEIKALHAQGVSWERLEELGLESRFIALYIQGKMTEEEMKKKLLLESWKYAKRQKTWFKKDERIKWFDIDEKKKIKKEISVFLK